MSVVSCNEMRVSRSGDKQISGNTQTAERQFQVLTDSLTDDVDTILEAVGLPIPYSPHPTIRHIVASKFSAKQDESNYKWVVTVAYERTSMGGSAEDYVDPCKRPPAISFGYTQYNKVCAKAYKTIAGGDDVDDAQGLPTKTIQNSAKDLFNPPIMQEESNTTITIVRNERKWSPRQIKVWRNTTNSVALLIAGIDCGINEARMRNVSGVKVFETDDDGYNVKHYYTVTYEIEVCDKTHAREILDCGFYYYDSAVSNPPESDKKEFDVQDPKGKKKSKQEPGKLDGHGKKLADNTEPVYLKFQTYFQQDWTPLRLPVEE